MSKVIRLAAVLPASSEVNGIDHVKDAIVEHPDRLRYAIIAYRGRSINHNVETNTKTPTIEIERIESVGDQTNLPDAIRDALVDAAQSRLGHEPLPFDQTDPELVTVTYADERDDQVLPDDEDGDR